MLVQQCRQIPRGNRAKDLEIFELNLTLSIELIALNSRELLGVQLPKQEIAEAIERENVRYFVTSIASQETLLEIVKEELAKRRII